MKTPPAMRKLWNNGLKLIIIIIIFYCGLMFHITDTRAQKVASYTSAHITFEAIE